MCNDHGNDPFRIEQICAVSVTEDVANQRAVMAPTTGRLKQWITLRPSRPMHQNETLGNGLNHSMNSRPARDQDKGARKGSTPSTLTSPESSGTMDGVGDIEMGKTARIMEDE